MNMGSRLTSSNIKFSSVSQTEGMSQIHTESASAKLSVASFPIAINGVETVLPTTLVKNCLVSKTFTASEGPWEFASTLDLEEGELHYTDACTEAVSDVDHNSAHLLNEDDYVRMPVGFYKPIDADLDWYIYSMSDDIDIPSISVPRPLNLASLPPRPTPSPIVVPTPSPSPVVFAESQVKPESESVTTFWSGIKVEADTELKAIIAQRIEAEKKSQEVESVSIIEEDVEVEDEIFDAEDDLETLRKKAKNAAKKAAKAAAVPFDTFKAKYNSNFNIFSFLNACASRYGVAVAYNKYVSEANTENKHKLNALMDAAIMNDDRNGNAGEMMRLKKAEFNGAKRAFMCAIQSIGLAINWGSFWNGMEKMPAIDMVETPFQARRNKSKAEKEAEKAQREYDNALKMQKKEEELKAVVERSEAFEKLANKDEMAKTLVKSKMCMYALKGVQCAHKVCNFAHTMEELSPAKCVFGDRCKCKSVCQFMHDSESKESYIARMKIAVAPVKKAVDTISLPLHKLIGDKAQVKITKCEIITLGKCTESCPLHGGKKAVVESFVPNFTPVSSFVSKFVPKAESELKCSKVCSLFLEGKCFRKVCNFAHTYESYSPVECSFGSRCNKKGSCCFIHPGESKDVLCERMGYKAILATKPAPVVEAPTKIKVKLAPLVIEKPIIKAIPISIPMASVKVEKQEDKSWAGVAKKDFKRFEYKPVVHDGKFITIETDSVVNIMVGANNVDDALAYASNIKNKKYNIRLIKSDAQ